MTSEYGKTGGEGILNRILGLFGKQMVDVRPDDAADGSASAGPEQVTAQVPARSSEQSVSLAASSSTVPTQASAPKKRLVPKRPSHCPVIVTKRLVGAQPFPTTS